MVTSGFHSSTARYVSETLMCPKFLDLFGRVASNHDLEFSTLCETQRYRSCKCDLLWYHRDDLTSGSHSFATGSLEKHFRCTSALTSSLHVSNVVLTKPRSSSEPSKAKVASPSERRRIRKRTFVISIHFCVLRRCPRRTLRRLANRLLTC